MSLVCHLTSEDIKNKEVEAVEKKGKKQKRGTTNKQTKNFLKRKRRQEMSASSGTKAGYT